MSDQKYLQAGNDYFMRLPSGKLIPVTREDWEAHKAEDAFVQDNDEWIAAHGPADPVRDRGDRAAPVVRNAQQLAEEETAE